jgi:hypothetical protein
MPFSQESMSANPLDRIEHIAETRQWPIERSGPDEVRMAVESGWGNLHLSLEWHEDLEGLHLSSGFDFKVPAGRRPEAARLIAMVNEGLYFGHFDLWREDGSILFRNGLILAGGAEANEPQCERLIGLAVETCERYYPAFQFVVWGGKTAEDAIEASLLDTVGSA